MSEPSEMYCDMETSGGGFTLVYRSSYGFTEYGLFTNESNAVTPAPNWPAGKLGLISLMSQI